MTTVFRANVELLKDNAGSSGRKNPTHSGYRPHVVVEGTEALLGVKFLEGMKFGANDVIFAPLYKDVDYSGIQDGTRFEVREGARVIGLGQIIERVD